MNKRTKALVGVFLAMILTVTAVFQYSLNVNASTDIRVTYKIISNAQTPSISKGSSFEADFYFYGKNAGDIKDIYVSSPNGSIAGLSKDSYDNFTKLYNYNSDVDPSIIDGVDITKLNIPESNLRYVGKGPGTLKFKVVLNDNTSITLQKTITECQVTAASSGSDRSDLTMQSYSLNRSGIKEGERFTLNLSVKNNGDVQNNHVTAVLDGLNSDEITVDGQMDTKTVDTLDAGSAVNISFPMICNPKMVTKNYIIKVQFYSDEASSPSTYNIFVPVTGSKSDKDTSSSAIGSSKPQIIIESYDYGGKAVTGGKEFVLTMNIKNTGTTAIENVKMTVSSAADTSSGGEAGGAFTPAKSSNTFFIPRLAGGATIREQIALLPKSDAAPKSYGVGIAFKYEAVLDSKRESLEADETVAIPLTQPDRFEVNDPEISGPMFLGQQNQMNINYVNKGKSKIFNLSVKLTGNFTAAEANSYIGNVETGTGDTYQASITPNEEGTLKGTAEFSYEDANGTTKTLTKEFSCEVVSDQGPPDDETSSEPTDHTDAGKAFPFWIAAAGVGGAALITGGILIFLKKQKKKKLRMLEQNDDYDDAV